MEEEIQGFDFRTHIIDPKTGKLVVYQPYSMHCKQGEPTILTRNGIRYTMDGKPLPNQEKAKEINLPLGNPSQVKVNRDSKLS